MMAFTRLKRKREREFLRKQVRALKKAKQFKQPAKEDSPKCGNGTPVVSKR